MVDTVWLYSNGCCMESIYSLHTHTATYGHTAVALSTYVVRASAPTCLSLDPMLTCKHGEGTSHAFVALNMRQHYLRPTLDPRRCLVGLDNLGEGNKVGNNGFARCSDLRDSWCDVHVCFR